MLGKPAVAFLLVAVLFAGCTQGPASVSTSTTAHMTGKVTHTTTVTHTDSNTEAPYGPPDPPGNGTAPPPADPTAPAPGAPRNWTKPDVASIRPGVQMFDDGSQCTANFVFQSPDNLTVYIGFAAHCTNDCPSNAGGECDTNGCAATNQPHKLNTTIEIDGASKAGRLAYTSWGTMQAVKENDGDACQYNDFAVVALNAADYNRVSPAMRYYGGPVGLADASKVQTQDKVLTYGNSGLRPEGSTLSPKEGYVISPPGSGWTTEIYTATPGVPGDSGSGVLTADGHALGDLVTVAIAPLPGSNGVSILAKELAYAKAHAGLDFRLATWELLDGGRLP